MDKHKKYIDNFNMPLPVYTLRKALQFLIPFLYLLISISFYLRTYDSAQVKITLLQMGGLSIVAIWLSLLFLEGKKAFSKDDLVFLSPFISYFLYIIFSFVNVPYKQWAIDDFIRYILYSFVSLIVIREFDRETIERLTKFLIVSVWIVVAYGIVQWIDVTFFPPDNIGGGFFDPFIWRKAFANRIFSTYGNPNFFGNYMVLMLPIVIARFLKTKNLSLLILGVLDVFCLINTYTKGAWIGFGISSLLFIALYIYYFTDISKKMIKIIYFFLIILAFIIMAGVVNYAMKTSRTSVPFRIATWLSTWEMIETHPLIGSGVGSFRPLYPTYRRPIIFHLEGKHNTETDHSENEHLEQILDNGIIGAGIFYWIIFFVTVTALRAMKFNIENKEKDNAYDILGYLVAFLGMLIHNFTDVSMRFVSSGVYFGLLPSVIINLSRGHALWEFHYMESGEKNKVKKVEETIPVLNKILGFIAISVLIFCSYKIISEFASIGGDFSNQSAGDSILWLASWSIFIFLIGYISYTLIKAIGKSYNLYMAVIVIIFYFPLRYFPTHYFWNWFKVKHSSDPIRTYSVYYFWGWFKADVEHNIAIYFSKRGEWDSALSFYQKVVKDNPTFIMPYYFMGNVFTDRFNMAKIYREDWGDSNGVARDDFERAMDMYEHVRALAPNYVQMHHQVGVLYMKMAEYLRSQGKSEDALRYLDRALYRFEIYQNLDPVFPYNYFRRAQIWVYKGQLKKAEEEYIKYLTGWKCDKHNFAAAQKVYGVDHEGNGIEPPLTWKDIYPQLPEIYSNLGNIYFMMGDYKKAYENYRKALDKNPDYEPAKKNIIAARLKLGK